MSVWYKPRTIFATILYITFAYLTICGKIEPQIFMNVFFSVTAFYFAERGLKNATHKSDKWMPLEGCNLQA